MNFTLGSTLYHWYYGPVTIISIEKNNEVKIKVSEPQGVYTGGEYKDAYNLYTDKYFLLATSNEWLFEEPDLIINSKYYEEKSRHRDYSPEYKLYLINERLKHLETEYKILTELKTLRVKKEMINQDFVDMENEKSPREMKKDIVEKKPKLVIKVKDLEKEIYNLQAKYETQIGKKITNIGNCSIEEIDRAISIIDLEIYNKSK